MRVHNVMIHQGFCGTLDVHIFSQTIHSCRRCGFSLSEFIITLHLWLCAQDYNRGLAFWSVILRNALGCGVSYIIKQGSHCEGFNTVIGPLLVLKNNTTPRNQSTQHLHSNLKRPPPPPLGKAPPLAHFLLYANG